MKRVVGRVSDAASSGGGGVTSHPALTDRELPAQHPAEAISYGASDVKTTLDTITATTPVLSVSAGAGISVDNTDGQNPIVSTDLAPTFVLDIYDWAGTQVITDGTSFDVGDLALIKDPISDAGTAQSNPTYPTSFVFPSIEGNTGVNIRFRIEGDISGSSGRDRAWFYQMQRPATSSLIGSVQAIKIDGTSVGARDTLINSYTSGVSDLFSSDGVLLSLLNDTGADITITSLQMTIQRTT